MSEKTIRAQKVEVWTTEGDHKENRSKLLDLSRKCSQITNQIWQTWLVWHINNDSAAKQKEWLDKPKKERGPAPVKAVPPECSRAIYRKIADTFRDVNSRTQVLVMNNVTKKISSLKAAHGKLPGWVAILFCHQSHSATTKPQPIPFDRENSKLIPPETDDDNWKLEVRVGRVEVDGKDRGIGVTYVCELFTKGYKRKREADTCKKIYTGEWEFKGSNLWFDTRDGNITGKLFAHFCYRLPKEEPVKTDHRKKCKLIAEESHPFTLEFADGRKRTPGGTGHAVVAKRSSTNRKRFERKRNYRVTGSSNKGHGRKRAIRPAMVFSRDWRDFVKTYNRMIAADVVNQMIQLGVGCIEFEQPTGETRDSRFLTNAGKVDNIRENSGWDWFQFAKFLADKCHENGLDCTIVKNDDDEKELSVA